jgi:predicted phage terminase large subunit-like protein
MSTDGKQFIIHDVTHFKGQYTAIKDRVVQTMLTDPRGCTQYIENTLGGMVVKSDLIADKRLHGIAIKEVNAIKDKVARALPVSSRIAQGVVSMVQASWNREFIDELNAFGDSCEHDDQVDAMAHAYNCLGISQSAQSFNTGI